MLGSVEQVGDLAAVTGVEVPEAMREELSLDGSFSAVSTPPIASGVAFCSIFRNLRDFHIPLQCSKIKICTGLYYICMLLKKL